MRFRGRSIRRKIVALLLVPLVSLVAIWGFATVITGGDASGLRNAKLVRDAIGLPAGKTVDALAVERRTVLVFLADPSNSDSAFAVRDAQAATDRAISLIRARSDDPATRADLDATSRGRLDALMAKAEELDGLRRKADEGQISGSDAFAAYSAQINPYYTLSLGLDPLQSAELDRQSRVLTELSRAREAITREDALYTAAQIAGHMSRQDQRAFADAVSQQRTVYATYPVLLPATDSRPITAFWKNDKAARALHTDEERILDADPGQAVGQVDQGAWRSTTSSVLASLTTLDGRINADYGKRIQPFKSDVFTEAVIAGGFGLLAVIVSIVVSLRTARGLVRDLSALRREAQEASGTRLPRVMRRLAAGEEIDIETEVPRLDHADDEIGAVGKALDTLQRAAVEAAVRQADMRRGVSDVFVNLARRNQVLLHRQLTLLDSMERRTEAGEELADLFRLDHMTTRMRRHAEGLVILSGATPSRQWRKPVPLMDVVRASVAEVEDYERVEVRRLPRLAVTGSAVADFTHLVAELIENATVFSPPHTTVQVHGGRVANGYVLEVDDRGLGMPPETLLDANLRLSETPEFDLSDTDRLGLFVVSRLAQRHGIRVSLRPSPYGGTTAVVLVPNSMLTDSETEDTPHSAERTTPGAASRLAGDTLPDEITVPVGDDAPEREFRGWGRGGLTADVLQDFMGAEPENRRPARHRRPDDFTEQHQQAADRQDTDHGRPDRDFGEGASRHDDAGTTRPRGSTLDDNAPLPRRRRGSAIATESANHRGPGPDTERPPARNPDALPRRVRQASLAPQLRDRGPAPASAAQPVPERDPDEVRSRMASLQRGWQRGRTEADENMPGTDRTTRTAAVDTASPRGDANGTTSEGDSR